MRLNPSCVIALLLVSAPGLAQDFFGSGKPPIYREEDIDRRFLRSRVGRMLNEGSTNPNCQQLIGGLLSVLAEVAPTLHKRDADFTVENPLLQALQTQLSTESFPASLYLTAMVRRVEIDRKLPQEWLETAGKTQIQMTRFNDRGQPVGQYLGPDLSKLRFLAEGVQPIDSFAFTLEALRQAYDLQVQRATTASATSEREFREQFLDREVAWGNLRLVDLSPEKKKAKRKGKQALVEGNGLVATLEPILPVDPNAALRGPTQRLLNHNKPSAPKAPRIIARLAEKQYLPLEKLPRDVRVMVRGRLWEMDKKVMEFDLRNAIIFLNPDFTTSVALVAPDAVAKCPGAVNDLTGIAAGAAQPGGFGQHP